jgi:hypothetical protein
VVWREGDGERERAVAVLMIVEEPREVGPTAEGAGRWISARSTKLGPSLVPPLTCIQMQIYLPLIVYRVIVLSHLLILVNMYIDFI